MKICPRCNLSLLEGEPTTDDGTMHQVCRTDPKDFGMGACDIDPLTSGYIYMPAVRQALEDGYSPRQLEKRIQACIQFCMGMPTQCLESAVMPAGQEQWPHMRTVKIRSGGYSVDTIAMRLRSAITSIFSSASELESLESGQKLGSAKMTDDLFEVTMER